MSTHVSMSKEKMVAGLIAVIVVVFLISFFAGEAYGKSNVLAAGQNNQAQGGPGSQMRGMRGGRGGGFTVGQIIGEDATSITVGLPTGGSKTVFFSGSSTISKPVAGSASDLTTGENVMVTGTPNSDGSITATSIQIRPAAPSQTPTTGAPAASGN